MPLDSSRHGLIGTRYVSCSGVKLTGEVEMVPSAAQNCLSVQLVAAGQAVGNCGSAKSCSTGGRITDGRLLVLSGICGDFSSSCWTGGKYAPAGLVPCGTSLSRGGRY